MRNKSYATQSNYKGKGGIGGAQDGAEANGGMPQTNLDQISMILNEQTLQHHAMSKGLQGQPGPGGSQLSQGQINQAAGATSRAKPSGHTSKSNLLSKKQPTEPAAHEGTKERLNQIGTASVMHEGNSVLQLWMNQALPGQLGQEGGGSGGIGGSGSQEQIVDGEDAVRIDLRDGMRGASKVAIQMAGNNNNQQLQKMMNQQQQQQQHGQMGTMKNMMLIDQMYQMQQQPQQMATVQPVAVGKHHQQPVRARSNLNQTQGHGSGVAVGPGTNQMMAAHHQYLAQKNYLANVNSELQIQTAQAQGHGSKKGSHMSQKRKQMQKDMGNFEMGQEHAQNILMKTQSSKQRIIRDAQNNTISGQTNSQNLRVSNYNTNAAGGGHSKKNSHGQTANAQQFQNTKIVMDQAAGGRNQAYDRTFIMNNNDHGTLDAQMLHQNILLNTAHNQQNQTQQAHYRNTSTTIQGHTYKGSIGGGHGPQQNFAAGGSHSQGKGSRQGSKLRKNISNLRGGGQLKNQQRVSQQRRFNNTTLDNYQTQMVNNQLSTLQAVIPGFKNQPGANIAMVPNLQTIQQNSSQIGTGQHNYQQQTATITQNHTNFHNVNNTAGVGSKFDKQGGNASGTASKLLKAGGHGSSGNSGHSRTVLRQNQQQKQYLNNFLAPNKFPSSGVGAAAQNVMQEFTNGQHINAGGNLANNPIIISKKEPRSKSNLKAPYGQAFLAAQQALSHLPQPHHILGAGGPSTDNSAQFNNYLAQQNYLENSKVNSGVGGQSPLLKKGGQGAQHMGAPGMNNHKKSESVNPSMMHHGEGSMGGVATGQVKIPGHHSNSSEPVNLHGGAIKGNFSAMAQINITNNNQMLQNISNPNVALYQQYNSIKTQKNVQMVDSLVHDGANTSGQRVKKCDSDASNGTAERHHNQLSGDAMHGGRNSSNEQDGGVHHTGGMQQLRRNQPHNFSNISEKSSIMGDYGGTHTTHNSNQAKKSRQGLGGGILGIMGSNNNNSNQQDVPLHHHHQHQQFFNNRNGSASHVGSSANKQSATNTGGNVNNSMHSTQNTNSTGGNNQNIMSNSKSNGKTFGINGSGQDHTQQHIDGTVVSLTQAQRQSRGMVNGSGSAGRQSSGQQQSRHSRNPSSKYQTQQMVGAAPGAPSTVNMPGIATNKRIVISQKQQMQGQTLQQQQQQQILLAQTATAGGPGLMTTDPGNLKAQQQYGMAHGQISAMQALQNQQQMQHHLQQLHKQQPQLKNVLRSGNRSSDVSGYNSTSTQQQQNASTSKKGAQKFRKGGSGQQQQYGGAAAGNVVTGTMTLQNTPGTQQYQNNGKIVSKAQQLNGTMGATGFNQDGMARGVNVGMPGGGTGLDFGFVVDPVTMHGVIHDTVEHVQQPGGFQQYVLQDGAGGTSQPPGNNWTGARRLSMPMPNYQGGQQNPGGQNVQDPKSGQHGTGPVSKMIKNKMDIGAGIRTVGQQQLQNQGTQIKKVKNVKGDQTLQSNTGGALDSGTHNPNLFSEDHEAYDFEDEEEQGEDDEEEQVRAAGPGGLADHGGRLGMKVHGARIQNPTFDKRNAVKATHHGTNQMMQQQIHQRNTSGQKMATVQSDLSKAKAQGAAGTKKENASGFRITTKPQPTRVLMNINAPKQKIGTQDQILIKDNNVYLRDPSDEQTDTQQHLGKLVVAPGEVAGQVSGGPRHAGLHKRRADGQVFDGDILIQDDSVEKNKKGADAVKGGNENASMPRGASRGSTGENKVINYETFESSSEEEYSCGAFESAAASFQNKEKNEEAGASGIQEQKRLERQRRKERKAIEKRKQKEEQDRQGRNIIRKKYRIQSVGIEHYEQYQDDILNFKDSDRESLISYFENNSDVGQSQSRRGQSDLKINDNFFYRQKALDTPTRLLNHSNEFLPKKKKINAEKLATRVKQDEHLMKNIKNFQDIEEISNLEKSQKSTNRKAEEEKRDMLFKIVSKSEIEKLRTTLRSQLEKSGK